MSSHGKKETAVSRQAPGAQHPHRQQEQQHPHAHRHPHNQQEGDHRHHLPYDPHRTVLPAASQRFTPISSAANAASRTTAQAPQAVSSQKPSSIMAPSSQFTPAVRQAAAASVRPTTESKIASTQPAKNISMVNKGASAGPLRPAATQAPAPAATRQTTSAVEKNVSPTLTKQVSASTKSAHSVASSIKSNTSSGKAAPLLPIKSFKSPNAVTTAVLVPKQPERSSGPSPKEVAKAKRKRLTGESASPGRKQILAITDSPALLAITDSPKHKRQRKAGTNIMGHRLPWEVIGRRIRSRRARKLQKLRRAHSPMVNRKGALKGEFVTFSPFDEKFPKYSSHNEILTKGYVAVSPFDARFPKPEKLQKIYTPKRANTRINRTVWNSKHQRSVRRRKAFERSRRVFADGESKRCRFVSVSPWNAAAWNRIIARAEQKSRNGKSWNGFRAVSPFDPLFEQICKCKEFEAVSPFSAGFPASRIPIKVGRVPRTRVVWQQRVVGYTPAMVGTMNLHALPHGKTALPIRKIKSSSAKVNSVIKKPLADASPASSKHSSSIKKSTLPVPQANLNGAMKRIHDWYEFDGESPVHRPAVQSFPRFSPMAAKTAMHAHNSGFGMPKVNTKTNASIPARISSKQLRT